MRMNFLIDRPAAGTIQRLTARSANTVVK